MRGSVIAVLNYIMNHNSGHKTISDISNSSFNSATEIVDILLKVLEIIIDKNLNYEEHINLLAKKLTSAD